MLCRVDYATMLLLRHAFHFILMLLMLMPLTLFHDAMFAALHADTPLIDAVATLPF